MLAITVGISNAGPSWADLGPTSIAGQTGLGLVNQLNPVAGAVSAFANVPGTNTVFAATINGGVWKTDNINATKQIDVNQNNDPSLPQGAGR